MAYIGPEEGDPFTYEYNKGYQVEVVCQGVQSFVRVLNAEAYQVSGLPQFENLDI